MAIHWSGIYNRLWRLIDARGQSYFSGPRFLNTIRELNADLPGYNQFIVDRRAAGKSTSRKEYFYDVLMELDESKRWRAVNAILAEVEPCDRNAVEEIRALMNGPSAAPSVLIPANTWGAERLNVFLAEIDGAIAAGQYGRAVTLSYTCLEGFYGAFFRANAPTQSPPNEIIALSRWIRDYLRTSLANFPDEVLNLINQTSYAIDRARNRFSEAHFGGESARWLAIYARDLVNVQVRLLLHFM